MKWLYDKKSGIYSSGDFKIKEGFLTGNYYLYIKGKKIATYESIEEAKKQAELLIKG